MTTNSKEEVRKILEKMPAEIPRIQEVETHEHQFYIRVDGGRDVVDAVIEVLDESYVGEVYEVEVLHDFDSDDVDVRVVSPSLKKEEREAKERMNQLAEEFGI